jgi:uncharacterized membrane protein
MKRTPRPSGDPMKAIPALTAAATLVCAATAFAQPMFIRLGIADGADAPSANTVTADGSAVVIQRHGVFGGLVNSLWREGAGLVTLPPPPGATAFTPLLISGNGEVIIGLAHFPSQAPETFRLAGGVHEPLTGFTPAAISHDGSVIAGTSCSPSGVCGAVRWTAAGGIEFLGGLPHETDGFINGQVSGISADGEVIVGTAGVAAWCWRDPSEPIWLPCEWVTPFHQGFIWTRAAGVQPIPLPEPIVAGNRFTVLINGVSADGTSLFGDFSEAYAGTFSGSRWRAFRWTLSAGYEVVEPIPGGLQTNADAISGDGSIIIGEDYDTSVDMNVAIIWEAGKGTRRLRDVLVNDFGLVDAAVHLGSNAISADGRTIAGAIFPENHWQNDAYIGRLGNTPSGSGVEVALGGSISEAGGATLTFDNVTAGGETTLTFYQEPPVAPPPGFSTDNAIFFDVSTHAVYDGSATLCFNYGSGSFADPSQLRLMHFENNQWHDVTTTNDTVNSILCGEVSGFSPFAVVQPAYRIDGFYAPLASAGSPESTFRYGRTIPIKFRLLDETSLPHGDLQATIRLELIGATGSAVNQEVQATSADSGIYFRYDAGEQQYIYNLSTHNLLPGARYRLLVALPATGQWHSTTFGVR